MARLIDVDSTVKAISRLAEDMSINDRAVALLLALELNNEDRFPTADVVPVVRGEWARTADGYVKCSCCDSKFAHEFLYIFGRGYPKYCPFCGAKMGEVSE